MNLVSRVESAVTSANEGWSGLPAAVLELPGMSSPKVRRLLNNLAAARYMEVGVWQGSTLVSACYGRETQAFAFDDFSQFAADDPQAAFDRNVTQWLTPGKVDLHCGSFFDVPQAELPRDIDVYFYDGLHGYEPQRQAIVHAWPCLAGEAIIVVDDADFGDTIPGTRQGLQDVGATVRYAAHLPARFNGDVQQWWNGIYLLVISKRPAYPR